jgi:hypothetical protein
MTQEDLRKKLILFDATRAAQATTEYQEEWAKTINKQIWQ